MINRYVALDIETTGLNPAVDRIIEVGMARVEDGQITQKYSTLVYPGISVSERITELTGIHNEELAGKPRIEEIIGDITSFIGDWPILGHNVTFDFSFLKRAAVNNGYTITDDGIDTLKIARRLLPELEHKNLSFLCQYFNIDPGRSHRAYDDAVSASILYGKLEKLKPEDNSFSNTTKLVYVVKKDSPITPPQRRYLAALVEKHNINLEIPEKKITAFIGPSGCGKSTTASLLMRFCDPLSGKIYIEGKDYCSMKPEELRKHIAMVPQQVNLFSGTIRENLLLADPDAKDAALLEALEEAGLGAFIRSQSKGLDSDVGNAGSSLSGGQRQKMGIARALLSRAEYMIFDEATSSVDPQSEKEIWKTIGHLAESRTLIIISHRMSSVQTADCIYVLRDGRVAQHGTHEVLMAEAGLYKELVVRQQAMEVAE